MKMNFKPEKPALDAFMHIPVGDISIFSDACSSIRQLIEELPPTSTVVLPFRGSAPLYWSAAGYNSIESDIFNGLEVLTILSGTGYEQRTYIPDRPDDLRYGGTNGLTRERIAAAAISKIDPETPNITVIDEVQIGGRITSLSKLCVSYALRNDIPVPINAIAAEGSLKNDEAKRSNKYLYIRNGNNPNIKLYPINMPLIAVDESSLLPVLHRRINDFQRKSIDSSIVYPNTEAASHFRFFGSLSRLGLTDFDYTAYFADFESHHTIDERMRWFNMVASELCSIDSTALTA